MDHLTVEKVLTDDRLVRMEIENIKAGRNVNIQIQQFIANTDRYQKLDAKRLQLQRRLQEASPDSTDWATLRHQLTKIEEHIYAFKIDLLEYARTIHRVESSTSGILRMAKEQLYAGQLDRTDAVIQVDQLQLNQEQATAFLEIRQNLTDVYHKLMINAEEFLVKAQLTALNYDLPDRFSLTIRFFESSVTSARRAKPHVSVQIECLGAFGRFYLIHKHNNAAVPLYEEAIVLAQQMVLQKADEYRPTVASLKNHLAGLYTERGEFTKADSLYQEALDMFKFLAEKDNIAYWFNVINVMNNLAGNYLKHGKHAKARRYYGYCLEVFDNPVFSTEKEYAILKARGLGNIAVFYRDQKDYEQAIALGRESVAIYRSLIEQDDTLDEMAGLALSLNNLAVAHKENHNEKEAENIYRECYELLCEIAERNPELIQDDLAVVLINTANAWMDFDKVEEALTVFEEALSIMRKQNQRDPESFSPLLAVLLQNYGTALMEKEDWDQAMQVNAEAVQINRELAKDRSITQAKQLAQTLVNSGSLKAKTGNLEEARHEFEEAVAICDNMARRHAPTFKPLLAHAYGVMGDLLRDMQEPSMARKHYRQSLKIRQSLSKDKPRVFLPEVIKSWLALATLEEQQGNSTEAAKNYKEAAAIGAYLGEDISEHFLHQAADLYDKAGFLLEKTGDFKKAEHNYIKSVTIGRKILSIKRTEDVLKSQAAVLTALGQLYKKMREVKPAMQVLEESLNIYRDLAESDPETWSRFHCLSVLNIANLLASCSIWEGADQAYYEALIVIRETSERFPSNDHFSIRAMVAANIAHYHTKSQPDRRYALGFASESLYYALPRQETDEKARSYVEAAIEVVKHWGLDPDEYVRDIRDQIQ